MVPVPDPDFVLPTVDDVGALLRARTQDTADDEIGTFNDETRPTGEEVEIIIRQAGSVVLARTGSLNDPPLSCPTAPDVRANAAYLVSLLAAMLVELSYFPEQVRSDRSPYQNYKELFDEGIKGLIDAAVECRGGEVIPDEAGEGFRPGPSYSFPVDGGGLIGWQTQW